MGMFDENEGFDPFEGDDKDRHEFFKKLKHYLGGNSIPESILGLDSDDWTTKPGYFKKEEVDAFGNTWITEGFENKDKGVGVTRTHCIRPEDDDNSKPTIDVLNRLKNRLKSAIDAERYENAAEIKKKIDKVELALKTG